MTSAPSQDSFVVGQRVALKEPEMGSRYAPRGTVRYVGPVDGYKSEWVGVEWDDPLRGKHDGVVTGKRYFQCYMVPSGTPAGSFVRPQKLTGGITLREALLDRYSTSGADYKAEPIYRALGRRRAMVIEFVSAPANRAAAEGVAAEGAAAEGAEPGRGEDIGALEGQEEEKGVGRMEGEAEGKGEGEGKRNVEGAVTQSDSEGSREGVLGGREGRNEDKGDPSKKNGIWLSRLQAANVSDVPVGSIGAAGEVAAIASLTELDMSYHLLSDWHEVQRVGLELPALTALDIGHSRIQFPPPASEPCASPLAGLRKLGLNNTRVTWTQVEEISRQLPLLETLVLIRNEIAELQPISGSNCLQNLSYLDLSDNRITAWAQVAFLSALPSLQWLLLSGNQISKIGDTHTTAASEPTFRHLQHLSLANNGISDWSSIDALAVTCPNLKELVLSHKPYVPRLPSANQRIVPTSVAATGNVTPGSGTEGGQAANGSLPPGGAGATVTDGEESERVERSQCGVTEEGRMELIARLGSIQKLNSTQILARERMDAEMWYISHVIRSLPHATSLPQLVAAGHPSLPALLAKHALDLQSEQRKLLPMAAAAAATSAATGSGAGVVVPAVNGGVSASRTSTSSFISITFRVIGPGCGSSTGKEVTKKLPQSTTVSKMRPLVARLLKLDPSSFSLFLLPSTLEGVQPLPSLLLDDTEPLGVLLHSGTTAALDASQATILVDTSLDIRQASSLSKPQVLAREQQLRALLGQ
ncbi:hypothetical protein CLOM_g13685 [Closterium sp. NIES-68]|nr:hypothetical protein CLOM_g13685 [Closterium sp. NIES-68]